MTLGTMSYLSPEQATGTELGPASDVYGLGLVLLECVTGRPAFTGTMAEVATARLVSAPDVPVDLDPRLGDLLARMTRMAPQDRPDAREVAQDLAAILAGASGETLVMPAAESPASAAESSPGDALAAGGRRPALVGGAVSSSSAARCWSASSRPATATPVVPPSYPAVEGAVGESLTQLQESVEP